MAQAKVSTEFMLGAALIAVWGVEFVKSTFGLLTAPHDSLLESGASLEYLEFVNFWVGVRCVLSVVGVVAGLLVMKGRRLGYWMSILSGTFLVCYGTDLHWYIHLLPASLTDVPLTSFYLRTPGLGYAVIVFPVIVLCLTISSMVILYKRRRRDGR